MHMFVATKPGAPTTSRKLLRSTLLLSLVVGYAAIGAASAATPWTGTLPRANCGPGDRVETGLQGQTTIAERQSGASKTAYTCNLQLVG